MDSIMQKQKRKTMNTLVSVPLTMVLSVLGLINWFSLRELLLTMLPATPINPWAWQAIDNFSFVLLGIMWLVFVLYIQYYFVKSAETKRLSRSFSLVLGIQILLFFLCQFTPFAFNIARFDAIGWIVVLAELLVGVLLILFSRDIVFARK